MRALRRAALPLLLLLLTGGAARAELVVAGPVAAARLARGPNVPSGPVLLATRSGLEWFRSPGPLAVHVSPTPRLTGRVDGATGGSIRLYREPSRTLVGTFPVAADGSFSASDAGSSPAYRAVYAADGLPYAALVAAS